MTVQKKRGRPRKDPMIAAVEAPKKRGRPAGTRINRKPTVESVVAEWQRRYLDMLGYYDNMEKVLTSKLNNLEYQAVGYRSVISYLENKIEQLIANSVRGN
jgi:hypothetical protein